MRVEVELNSAEQIIKERGLEKGGRAQKFLDSEIMRLADPYVPMRVGVLKKGIGTVVGSGEIVYDTPYARYQYYGKVMVGYKSRSAWARADEYKVLTNADITYSGAPQRGKLWIPRMVADKGAALTRAFAAFIGGKPG